MYPISRWLSTLAVVTTLTTPAGAAQCPPADATIRLNVTGQALTAAVAATPATRQCGLAHRAELRPNHGMLFVFPRSQPLTFWMKDTRLSLSIAFLDGSGEILAIERMDPNHPLRRHHSPGPARYALEMERGWFERHGVTAGDHCQFRLPDGLPVR